MADSTLIPQPNDELRLSSSTPKKKGTLALGSIVALCILFATTLPPKSTQAASSSRFRGLQTSEQEPEPQEEPQEELQPFSFDAPFGSNMVLQYGKHTQAAIYGYLGPKCKGVELHLYESKPHDPFHSSIFVSYQASINATHQPYNQNENDTTWGSRPCSAEHCPSDTYNFNDIDYMPFTPYNQPLPTWKVLLPPQPTPGGNYSVVAMCQDSLGAAGDPNLVLYNITYGDVWYCSGQSNMQLWLKHTFGRQELFRQIQEDHKYHNIRVMAGDSGNRVYYANANRPAYHPTPEFNMASYGSAEGTNPWMTSYQALHSEPDDHRFQNRLEMVGGTCWYFAQHLTNLGGVEYPIGLINTAIGGKRIQEFVDNRTISRCHERTRSGDGDAERYLWWESQLYASQVLPFVDMTLKGFLWYQGENNMYEVKGNSAEHIGYSCEMKALVESWRKVWSETPNTTSPVAPFGIVTIAPDGNEGGPDIGTMRHAQTANYGVLPPPQYPIHDLDAADSLLEDDIGMANTFLAQAYDLPDEWNAASSPCVELKCCDGREYDATKCSNQTLHDLCNSEQGACTVKKETDYYMGGIHPRSKSEVGQRLAIAAHNLFFGGNDAYTGPTLQGCSVNEDERILEVEFNATLMRGDTLAEPVYPDLVRFPNTMNPELHQITAGGSQLYVQTHDNDFCMEEFLLVKGELRNDKSKFICPQWAGGKLKKGRHGYHEPKPQTGPFNSGWIEVPYSLKNGHTLVADLSGIPAKHSPTAVMYGWGNIDCCDYNDPDLFVTKGCIANCPLKSKQGQLPANPFKARIVEGKCECVAPQECSGKHGNKIVGVG